MNSDKQNPARREEQAARAGRPPEDLRAISIRIRRSRELAERMKGGKA